LIRVLVLDPCFAVAGPLAGLDGVEVDAVGSSAGLADVGEGFDAVVASGPEGLRLCRELLGAGDGSAPVVGLARDPGEVTAWLDAGAADVLLGAPAPAELAERCRRRADGPDLATAVPRRLFDACLAEERRTHARARERDRRSLLELTERARGLEEALRTQRDTEERFRQLVEAFPHFVPWEADLRVGFTYVGPQAVQLLGHPLSEWYDGRFWERHLHPDDRERVMRSLASSSRDEATELEYRVLDVEGRAVWFWDQVVLTRRERGRRLLRGIMFDVTKRKETEAALRASEEQFLQAQRLEAVGQLASGVAHDFNNLLTAIGGYTQLLEATLEDERHRHYAAQVRRAAERAGRLTSQLLAFSRKSVLDMRVLDPGEVLRDLRPMLESVGEDVQLTCRVAPGVGRIRADRAQVEQVLMNLAVNARDAMPGGGRLAIEVRNADVSAAQARSTHVAFEPGAYVLFSVSDTGEGMDDETRARVFEPFFTTKERGKGTGLGLASVYGVVKQSGGFIWVHSRPGEGTTFRIYFPRVEARPDPEPATADPAAAAAGGDEAVLLVEDDLMVRGYMREILESRGYRVLEARDGSEGLAVAERHADPIDLVITDVVMPNTSGPELVARLQEVRPGVPILYVSGRSDHAIFRGGALRGDVALVEKPFTPADLAAKVRAALDGRAPKLEP